MDFKDDKERIEYLKLAGAKINDMVEEYNFNRTVGDPERATQLHKAILIAKSVFKKVQKPLRAKSYKNYKENLCITNKQ